MTDPGHVIWAWDQHIWDFKAHGLSVTQIRAKLREEYSLHVGEKAIRDVLKSMPRGWVASRDL